MLFPLFVKRAGVIFSLQKKTSRVGYLLIVAGQHTFRIRYCYHQSHGINRRVTKTATLIKIGKGWENFVMLSETKNLAFV